MLSHDFMEMKQKVEVLGKKPISLFEYLGLTVYFVDVLDFKSRPEGRFFYDGVNFSRVELVAEHFFEKLGFYASWSEGRSIKICFELIGKLFARRFFDKYKIESFRSDRYAALFSKDAQLNFKLNPVDDLKFSRVVVAHVIKSIGEKLNPPAKESIFHDAVKLVKINPLLSSVVSDDVLIETYLNVSNSLQELVSGDEFDEILATCGEVYKPAGLSDNPYLEQDRDFAKKICVELGLAKQFIPHLHEESYCSVFDLTLVRKEDGKIFFIEVKNKDSMTYAQTRLLSQQLFYEGDASRIALCVVRATPG